MRLILALVLMTALAERSAAQEVLAAETAAPAADVTTAATPAIPEPDASETKTLLILDAADVSLAKFQWIARPVVVFADSPADPRFAEQMELLQERPEELILRDVVVLTDTDPSARSEVRLKLRPRGFMLTLIDKDGTVNLRKPAPWDVRELSRAIDKMPSRQQEIRDLKMSGE